MTLAFSGCGSDDGKLHDGYYREVVMQANGQFIGKGKLSESEAAKAGDIYKVEMSKDNKDQVARITAMYGDKAVRRASWNTKEGLWSGIFSTILVTPQENGYMKYEFLDQSGDPCMGFFGAYSIRFKEDEKTKKAKAAYFYNRYGENQAEGGLHPISQIFFSYDDKGRLKKVSAADESGTQKKAAWLGGGDASVLLIKYDQKKEDRISELTWLNAGGNVVKGGVWANEKLTYDDQGRLIEKAFFGADGNPIIDDSSPGIIQNISDSGSIKNTFEEVKEKEAGAGAVTKYTYEGDSTLPSRIDFLGKTGQSYGLQYNNHISSIQLSYDEKGNIIKYSAYGPDGMNKAIHSSDKNIDTIQATYDENGNISKIIFYHGENKAPLQSGKFANHNVSEIQYTYNEDGRVISESYYDANGSPADLQIYGKIKYQKTTYSYDDEGLRKKEAMYAQDGTEISTDPLKAIYGKYKVVNPVTMYQKSMILELKENEVALYLDPQYAEEMETKYHQKPASQTERVVYTANIDEISGKGTLKFNKYTTMDVDISAGTLSEFGTTWKRID